MKDVTADEIKSLIQIFDESEWKELALQVEDFRIFLSRDPASAGAPWQASASAAAPAPPAAGQALTAPASAPAAPAAASASASGAGAAQADEAPVPDNCVVVKAPNLGIFYRSPKPGSPPYVELGAEVDEDTEICLIEVMKLFTPVHAGMRGIVRHICIDDGEMVEHGQPLFYIEAAE